ncbi:tyrosine-type recombinase/integrase [Sulfitobacter sp. 1A12157]|uniref:tyrosine-type recombinase/integrase n=1 Tax=Sulfitobacter sp. 1A12157 TaxID=3368594 RepID=UPI00374622CE
MNEQNVNRVNTLRDVALLLPQIYSESSAKAYQAAFHRVEKLTGQRLAHLPADEKSWSDLSAKIVWAGTFKGRTQQAAERAFETWRGKISAAIKRAKAQTGEIPENQLDAAQAWDVILGYVKSVQNTFNAEDERILPNMSSLSISNLRARFNTHAPANLSTEIAETTLLALPADKAATFRRSIRFFDRLIAERDQHSPIAALLPGAPLGPLRSLRDRPIVWGRFPDSFRISLQHMIKVAIRGHAPRRDPLADQLGEDPLAIRRAARKDRRKPVKNAEVAEKSYKAALSWLARHAYVDRRSVYELADVRGLLTAEAIDRATARYVSRAEGDPALMKVQTTSSLSSYLAVLSTLARTNQCDESVLHAIEDARWDRGNWSPYSNEMSGVREAFVKKIDRDPEIVRNILKGPRTLIQEAQRDFQNWNQLSSHARSRTLHISMSAAILALQLARPLRTKNINQLTISGATPDLTAPRGKDKPAWLDISRVAVKNHRNIECPLPGSTWSVLNFWIVNGRSQWLEMHADSQVSNDVHLFPGSKNGRPICRQTLNTAWNRGIARLGLTGMTPHMMRHVAATIFLTQYPGQYGAVADLLGDRRETVEAFYARGAGQAAARLFAEVLEELEPSLKLGRKAR